ncbi:MAG: dicarboxylate/amino acid:cation symporter [Janthinobacterium lividum]
MTAGAVLHAMVPAPVAQSVADDAGVVAELFLRLIRMIIAPLVFATLAGGIAGMRGGSIGKSALLAMAWFVTASLVSLGLGLVAANLLQPGVGLSLSLPHGTAGIAASFDVRSFITHLVPSSLIDAMARNDIVQIVVFASLFGTAVAAMPEAASTRLRGMLADLAEAMLVLTRLVMRLAPIAVFAALFATFARGGIGMAGSFAVFIGGFYATMLVLWALLAGAGFVLLGRPVFVLLRMIVPAGMVAFATASSEAVFPLMVETLERFGVSPRLVGFVLPLGYAFNLDGSMLFQAFAALFIAQAYGIPLTAGQQVGMLLVLMVSSKGTAGVPRAAIVALAAVMPAFGLPDAGLLLILGVDHLLDMGRTATNVVGNAIATAVVARRTEPAGPSIPAGSRPG